MSKKCLRCKVRGDCCYVNVEIEGYNIILENVYCPMLDIDTGLCKDYPNRLENPWCMRNPEMFEKGCLPRECEYLKEGNYEKNPKIHLGEILNDHTIPKEKKYRIWFEYRKYDIIPFQEYIKILYKRAEVSVT